MRKDLLHKYFKESVSNEELEKVLDWAEATPENQAELLRERRLYDMLLFSKESEKINKRNIFKRIYPTIATIAAAVTIAILVFNNQTESQLFQTITVPSGQRTQIALADGSIVWLNANTTLRYSNDFGRNNRTLSIEGEGYFEVKKNEDLPFEVLMNNVMVRVTGTKFNVSSNSQLKRSEIILVEGSVNIYGAGENKKLMSKLIPGEKFTLMGHTYTKSPISTYSEICWKDGLYSFKNKQFTDIISELENDYSIKIIINTPEILQRHYTGKFKKEDGVQHILNVLRKADTFNYTFNEKRDTIFIN